MPQRDDAPDADLVERLERYRKRVRSEGRPRAVAKLDRAIADAANLAKDRR